MAKRFGAVLLKPIQILESVLAPNRIQTMLIGLETPKLTYMELTLS
jgi:hypothetical protein